MFDKRSLRVCYFGIVEAFKYETYVDKLQTKLGPNVEGNHQRHFMDCTIPT